MGCMYVCGYVSMGTGYQDSPFNIEKSFCNNNFLHCMTLHYLYLYNCFLSVFCSQTVYSSLLNMASSPVALIQKTPRNEFC